MPILKVVYAITSTGNKERNDKDAHISHKQYYLNLFVFRIKVMMIDMSNTVCLDRLY